MATRKKKQPDTPAEGNPFLTLALSRWQTANTAETDLRTNGQRDLRFLNLQQWETDDYNDRIAQDKPTLTIDQIGEPYRQLVGSIRSAKPSINVSPIDNGADVDTADVFQALIRHVEVTGNAASARLEASKGMCGPGWGYYRLLTAYEYDAEPPPTPEAIFDQCIKYQAIENQFTVFRDPACPLHEPWKARFCHVIEDMPKDEFTEKYPHAIATSQDAFQATGVQAPDWFPEGYVRVSDYYYTELVDDETQPVYAQLGDGRVLPLDQVPPNTVILQQRRAQKRVVKLAKITGAEILEGNADKTGGRDQVWPYIPVVPMYGESIVVDGKRSIRGIVRAALDAQRMYNYHSSELAYELALAPKSKVMAPAEAIEPYKDIWKRSPSNAEPVLPWVQWGPEGREYKQPQVAQFTDPAKIQALVVARDSDKQDLRTTTGWYDATDPSRKNTDQSGRAILARKEAQAESSINYKDNYRAALLFEGMLLVGAIPKVYYRTGRILRLLGEDDKPIDPVTVGGPWKRKSAKTRRGIQGMFTWGAGRYDIVVDLGAAYTTRRQESAQTKLELMKVLPETMAASIAPLAVRDMDIPGSQEMADRLDAALPPNLKGEQGDEMDPDQMRHMLQQAEAKMQEMGQVISGLRQAIQTDQIKIEGDLVKQREGDAVKLEIARIGAETTAMQVRADLIKAAAELDAASAKVLLQEETKRLLKLSDLEAETRHAATDRAFQAAQADDGREEGEHGTQEGR